MDNCFLCRLQRYTLSCTVYKILTALTSPYVEGNYGEYQKCLSKIGRFTVGQLFKIRKKLKKNRLIVTYIFSSTYTVNKRMISYKVNHFIWQYWNGNTHKINYPRKNDNKNSATNKTKNTTKYDKIIYYSIRTPDRKID